MRCIFIHEEWFEVHTCWGWFRLDLGAYRDYLAGKLWITWVPAVARSSAAKEEEIVPDQVLPPSISRAAIMIRDEAAKKYPYLNAEVRSDEEYPEIPFKARMRRISIGELPLSVRASNCLMRAGASTFGALNELIQSENGLRSIRDLGKKSEEEIIQCFFEACYHLLTPVEQAQYWQMLLDANAERHKGDYPFVE